MGRKACCQRCNSHFLYIIYNLFVDRLHDRVFFVVHAQAPSLFYQKYRQACCARAKGIFSPKMLHRLGLLLSIHKPFLVEIELTVVDKTNNVLWTP